eukprot:gb/GFBE01046310.1/.p1 GENE.gb/GFBE01046310.1/~~gb/GFBE01046310.1/.p1  ORF type:complete len:150 (+),score=30.64 gb/GFBE01046310.1/:1-450(+)
MRREKHRRSYCFRAWRIDLTTVRSTTRGSTPETFHEVELELNGSFLRKNLEAKLAGNKTHKLWELLTDFLNAGRDLAVLASEPWPLPLPPALPKASSQSAETDAVLETDREAYKRSLPEMPEPLIGHYLYKLAAKGWPLQKKPRKTVGL